MDAVQQSVVQLQQLFLQRMDSYQKDLHAAAPSPTVSNLASDFYAFRSFMMTALQSLQEQVNLLLRQQDNMEMHSRRKIVLFHGIQEAKDEVTKEVVAKAVSSHFNLPDFKVEDIARCHRMGRNRSPDKPRPILVKLCNIDTRNKIWFAKSGLKGSGLTLTEFLTKSRHDTFMEARHRFGIHKCWTRDGFVHVLDADGMRHRICTLSELEKIPVTAASSQPAPVATKEPAPTKSRRAATKK